MFPRFRDLSASFAALMLALMLEPVASRAIAADPPPPIQPITITKPDTAHPTDAAVALAIDLPALRSLLARAPLSRDDQPLSAYALAIDLPDPTGALTPCLIAEAPVMHPDLQAKFPLIRTYIVQSRDRSATGRLELSPRGLSAMLRTPLGTWMIDPDHTPAPKQPPESQHASAFWLHQRVARAAAHNAAIGEPSAGIDWTCHTLEGPHGLPAPDTANQPAPARSGADRGPGTSPQIRRTLRLAVACSGEWGAHQCALRNNPPNVADALAEIVVNVSRANVVYEGDLALSFQLVANNSAIVFTDPATDPYPDACDGTGGTDCSSGYLSPNVTAIDNAIGPGNYDVGHVLTRVFGGVAQLSSICGPSKAAGVSGIPRGGDSSALAFLVFIHELGHQLGASHTFSGTRGRCGNNAVLASAWEAGSGSSPMAYAGGCPVGSDPPSDNVAIFADPFFHSGSINQMRTFITGAACAAQSSSSNTPPTFTSLPPNLAIPPETPFLLTALATDPNSDPLTFSWEQIDSGVRRPLSGTGSEDTGQGALFRIFPPTPSTSRSFPKLADVLTAIPTPGEKLPTVTGVVRRFRCIVRDNAPLAGASVVSPFTELTIAAGSSKFALTAPPAGASLPPGPTTITWLVGNTNIAPISCTSVQVLLSPDDGQSFPSTLATVPNTGSASISLPPNIPRARIRLSAVGNVFYSISSPFSIRPCPGDFNLDGAVSAQDIFAFIAAWFAASPSADLDQPPNGVTIQDLFTFLERWFQPCP